MSFFYNEKEDEVRGGRIAAASIGGVAAIVLNVPADTVKAAVENSNEGAVPQGE